MVHSGSRPLVQLVARIAPALDSGSSIFMGSFSKNLALVAVGTWVGRRYGNIITSVITTDRHPRWLAWRRRVHRGRRTSGPSTTGMRWFDGAPARGPCWPQLIFVGDADKALNGGSPLIKLFRSRRKVEEQLRAPKLLLAWVAAKAAWTVTRSDF